MSTPAESALAYAARGWPVIPLHSPKSGGCSCSNPGCESAGKHPRCLHGLKDATTDSEKVARWWKQWPDANLGISIPSDLVVVDVDGKAGGAALERDGRTMPATVSSRTGRGTHHFFRTSRPVPPKVAVLPEVDLRGPGSYVVAPPSLHSSGKRYEWIVPPEGNAIAEAPAWVYTAQDETPAPGDPGSGGDLIPQGQRNRSLASLGGTMRKRGMAQETIEAALLTENTARCRPPLPKSEVIRIAKSVSRYEPAPNHFPRAVTPSTGIKALEELDIRKMLREGIPKPVYDLEDFLVRRTVTYLTGNPKGFKTWLALSWACRLASGGKWAGLETRGDHRILFLEAESPMQIPDRFRRWCLANFLNPEPLLDRIKFVFPPSRLRLEFPDHFDQVRRLVESFRATWIVVDSFVRIHGSDENSSRDMAALANSAFLPLRDHLGCGVLILDHPPKPLHDGQRTRKEQIRGSWEKLAAADAQIHVETRETETGKIAAVSVGASRFGPEREEPLFVRLHDTPNCGTDFIPVDAPAEPVAGRPATAREKAAAVIREALAKNPALGFSEAMKAVEGAGVSKETGKRAWKEVKGQGSEGSEGSQMVLTPDRRQEVRLGSKGSTPL